MIRFTSTDRRKRATLRRGRDTTLGQSLVEFALVLPILLFLTLIALDFGRVYLGYINLQNMARIAANFAGNNPTAWDGTVVANDAVLKTKYFNQIIADAQAINCQLVDTNGDGKIDASDFTPTFTDRNGNGSVTDIGDTGQVQIGCRFAVITPGIASVVGGTVKVAATSSFPVKTGHDRHRQRRRRWRQRAQRGVQRRTASSRPSPRRSRSPASRRSTSNSGTRPAATRRRGCGPSRTTGTTSTLQDPLNHTFTTAGTYTVTMKAMNLYGSSTASMTVTVVAGLDGQLHGEPDQHHAGHERSQFTDTSTAGGTAWAWTFGTGEGTSSLQNPTHVYNTTGTYTVSLTVTYPSPTGAITTTKIGYITVQVGNCLVPSLNGVKFNSAAGVYQRVALQLHRCRHPRRPARRTATSPSPRRA